jgi:hypothetical protein
MWADLRVVIAEEKEPETHYKYLELTESSPTSSESLTSDKITKRQLKSAMLSKSICDTLEVCCPAQ